MIHKTKYNFRIPGMIILIPLLVLLFSNIAFSQKPTLEWIQEFSLTQNPTSFNYFSDMVLDEYNNIYVTGWAEEIFTLKYDPSGNLLWYKTYTDDNSSMTARKIRIDDSGNVYVGGHNLSNWYVIKYDSQGNLVWVWKKVGWGTFNELLVMEVTDFGEIYVAGGMEEQFGPSTREFKTIKLSTDGDTLWSRVVPYVRLHSPNAATAMVFDKSKNVVVSGVIWTSSGDWKQSTVKYTTDGELLWHSDFLPSELRQSTPVDIKVSKTNNIYISSECGGYEPTASDFCTIKLDSNGTVIWYRVYAHLPNPSYDTPTEMALDNEENTYITGYVTLLAEGYNFCTLKYDKNGNLLWEKFYNNPQINRYDFGRSIALDKQNNVYVTGSSEYSFGPFQATSIKYNEDGDLLWIDKYPTNPSGFHWDGLKIRIDNNDNILVGGNGVRASDSNWITFVLKYSLPVSNAHIIDPIPYEYFLYQNYPNPFNPVTKIKFDVHKGSNVKLKVYDVSGKLKVEIVNDYFIAGNYEVLYDGGGLSSGIYFYTLLINNKKVSTRKMILTK